MCVCVYVRVYMCVYASARVYVSVIKRKRHIITDFYLSNTLKNIFTIRRSLVCLPRHHC